MKILVELIDNSELCSDRHDTRYHTLVDICLELHKRGHEIYALYKKNAFKSSFPFLSYKQDYKNIIDFYIGHSVYKTSKERYNFFKNVKKIPVMTYEAGWFYNSLFVDRIKLFKDSYYADKLGHLIEQDYDEQKALELCQSLIQSGTSKWKQANVNKIPNIKYIFIPGQVLHDLSITHYSNTDLKTFITKVIHFGQKHNLHVIYKPHPGMTHKDKAHGKRELDKFVESMQLKHKNFRSITTSIYQLMQHAEFTAGVNPGSVVDNMITQTPTYCCGRSMFMTTGSVIHNENVEDGLSYMYENKYDLDHMKKQQLKTVWWLHNHLIYEHLPADEKVRRLEYHSGLTL